VQDTPIHYRDEIIPVTVSIGVSLISAEDNSVDAVLARADQALYEAKHGGRNTVRLVLV
jgi:diguanylate cyclase (GGDEF)-like protein